VVHGGLVYTQPVRVDAAVVRSLEQFVPLAPLHQPHNLTPIRLLLERIPDVPQVACFDTSFHRTAPPISQRFAIPSEMHDAGVQRYGFHGLSYEYVASVLPACDARAAQGRTVVLHLGNGASMCALEASKSVASTMGFTAVEGLPMGTRCGAIDPGVMLYLMDQRGMDARAIEKLIYKESGLLGVSGISSDMRALLASEDPRAKLAIELYVYRIGRELGSLAAALGGLDAIVFTAGIGEHAPAIREAVCRRAAWLGVELDPAANAGGGPRISTPASRVSAWVIPTNEELMIARHTARILHGSAAPRAVA
jgi:acetate kinase